MANKRIKDIGTTATSLASDDFVAVDGSSQGTRKIQKANLVNDISSEIAGTYLDESNNLSDVASKDTSKLNLEVPNVGVSPNEVPLSGQLGTMAFQDSAGVSVEQLEVTDKIDGSVEIADEDNCTLTLRSDSDNNSGSRNTQIQFQIDAGTTKGLVSYDQDADVMQMSYGGNNKHLVVDSSGRVGIGTSSPGSLIEAAGASPVVEINATSGSPELQFSDGGTDEYSIMYDTGSSSLKFIEGGVGTRATIDSSGNVTVASGDVTATAGQFNSGASNASTPGFAVSTGNGIYNSGANQIGFSTNSTQRAVIDSSGRIGQAGVAPGSYHANADNLVLANEGLGGDTGLTIRSGTSGTGAIHFADGTSGTDRYRGYISYTQSSDTLNFATSGTTRWSIGSGGVLLGAAGNGIRFDTGTTLDSYEEGTWTVADGSGAGLTFTYAEGTYIKVGNQVTCWARIEYPVTSDTTAAAVQGFPFPFGGSTVDRVGGPVVYTNYGEYISVLGVNSQSKIQIFRTTGSGPTNANLSGKQVWFSATYNVS